MSAQVSIVLILVSNDHPPQTLKLRSFAINPDTKFSSFQDFACQILDVIPSSFFYKVPLSDVEFEEKLIGREEDLREVMLFHAELQKDSPLEPLVIYVRGLSHGTSASPRSPSASSRLRLSLPTTPQTPPSQYSSSFRIHSSRSHYSSESTSPSKRSPTRYRSTSSTPRSAPPMTPRTPLSARSSSRSGAPLTPRRQSVMSTIPFEPMKGGVVPTTGRELMKIPVHPNHPMSLSALVFEKPAPTFFLPKRPSPLDVSNGKTFSDETVERLLNFKKVKETKHDEIVKKVVNEVDDRARSHSKKLTKEEIQASVQRQYEAKKNFEKKRQEYVEKLYPISTKVVKKEVIDDFLERMEYASLKKNGSSSPRTPRSNRAYSAGRTPRSSGSTAIGEIPNSSSQPLSPSFAGNHNNTPIHQNSHPTKSFVELSSPHHPIIEDHHQHMSAPHAISSTLGHSDHHSGVSTLEHLTPPDHQPPLNLSPESSKEEAVGVQKGEEGVSEVATQKNGENEKLPIGGEEGYPMITLCVEISSLPISENPNFHFIVTLLHQKLTFSEFNKKQIENENENENESKEEFAEVAKSGEIRATSSTSEFCVPFIFHKQQIYKICVYKLFDETIGEPILCAFSEFAVGELVACPSKSITCHMTRSDKEESGDEATALIQLSLSYKLTHHDVDGGSLPKSNATAFLERVMDGWELSLVAAIDFTKSNGDPKSHASLHHINLSSNSNEYENSLLSIGSILEHYDHDKRFPAFGFGGCRGQEPTSHCFPLTQKSPICVGVHGILEAYHRALESVSLSGPTNFAEIVKTTKRFAQDAKSCQEKRYFILLILTDGEITDLEHTKNAITSACDLPLSILIVGVGPTDFSKSDMLDQLHGETRRMVKFVSFREHQQDDPSFESLTRTALSEVPNQFLEYTKMIGT